MGRRKKAPIEDAIEITALLPWWAGLLLALISYFFLHYIATMEIPPISDISRFGSTAGKQLYKTLAHFGQMVVPFVFVIGAITSAFNRRKRERLFNAVAGAKTPPPALGMRQSSTSIVPRGNALNDMTWHEFEILVGEAFRRKGYTVKENLDKGPDGGVDLVLFDGSEKYLVQCKQWRAFKVGVKVVRELYGVMASTGAVGGFVVTSGEFTNDARSFAQGKNIELIDGPGLKRLIQGVQDSPAISDATPTAHLAKQCPKCGKEMALRTARRGAQAGQQFWRCKGYPGCKATMPMTN